MKLGHAVIAYNRTPSYAMKYSPFEVVDGVNHLMPLPITTLHKVFFKHMAILESKQPNARSS